MTNPDEIGRALGDAAFDRGERLTPDEHAALNHWSRWGSNSYPVLRVGRRWDLSHPLACGVPPFRTRAAAVAAWEGLLAKWRRMAGLEAHERATAGVPEPCS